MKFGSPPALWCLSYLFLLLSLKILLPRVLLNPAISQKAFCSSFATCFTCEQKSRCPFCADDVPPPSRLLPPQARQPYKGKRQHTLALHRCGWGPRLPSSCHRPPARSPPQTPLPTASSAAVDVTSQIQMPSSPQVELTVLWKLAPMRWASLTRASYSSSWPSKWLPLLSRQRPSTSLPK